MKFKYYLGFTVIFVLVTSVYVYKVLPDNFTVAMPTNDKIELPVAIWVAIILSLFFIMSLGFFLWDFLRSKMQNFFYQRDFMALMEQILNQSMGKNIGNTDYKQSNIRAIAKVLKRFELNPKIKTEACGIERIDRVFEIFEQIELGYEQDIKKYNMPYDNEFFIKNFMNKFKNDYRIGLNALKSSMPNSVKKEIFIRMLEFIEVKDLQKILDIEKIDTLDKDMGFAVVEFLQKKNSKVGDKYLAEIFKKAKFDIHDYLELAKRLKVFYSPDNWLKFFENLTLIDEKAEMSYLYVLCDLEMMDLLRQKLATLPRNEFLNIRAFVDLRMQNKNYPLYLFFGKF